MMLIVTEQHGDSANRRPGLFLTRPSGSFAAKEISPSQFGRNDSAKNIF